MFTAVLHSGPAKGLIADIPCAMDLIAAPSARRRNRGIFWQGRRKDVFRTPLLRFERRVLSVEAVEKKFCYIFQVDMVTVTEMTKSYWLNSESGKSTKKLLR